MAAAVGTGTVVVVARATGLLEGLPSLLAVGALVLALPTSTELSRRVLLTGAIVVGWLPVLWWTTVLDVPLGRVTWLIAVVAAALVGWVVGPGAGAWVRARRLVPRFRRVDMLTLGAAAFGVWLARPLLRPGSGAGALSTLMTGWDHSAHADMVWMIRNHGAVIGAFPVDPSGGTWSYAHYPQGFHALAAALVEAQQPHIGTAAVEMVLYARTVGVIVVLCAVLVAAAVCALPALRRRPAAATVVVTLLVGTLLLGPGGRVVSDGFAPYLVALAALMSAPFLVGSWPRVALPVHLLALGGLVMAVAHSWALLLVILVPVVAALGVPVTAQRWRADRRRWLAAGGVVLLTAWGVARAALLLLAGQQALGEIVTIPGGIHAPDLGLVIAAPLLAIGTCIGVRGRSGRDRSGPRGATADRVLVLGAAPALGALLAAWVGARLLMDTGELRYYFWKLGIGLIVTSVAVAAAAWALSLEGPGRPATGPRWLPVAAGTVLSLGASQIYGAVLPAAGWSASLQSAPGAQARAELRASGAAPAPGLAGVLTAADESAADDAPVVLLAYPRSSFGDPVQIGQWFNAMTGRWTDEDNELLKDWSTLDDTDESAIAATRRLLLSDPDVTVLVAGGKAEVVRAGVGADLAERVRGV